MKARLYALWRVALLCIAGTFLHLCLFSQQVARTIPNASSPEGLIGFLEFRPADYGSQKHPLIIFLHGIGERGDGTTQINSVANNAIPYYCANGATMRFTVNGRTSSFVVLSPQLSSNFGYWPTFYVKEMIRYAKANLKIDTNRIYVTGLSLGGGGVWRVITDTENFDHSFDGTIAAAAPVCGTQEMSDADFCTTIGTNHLPVWAFHCMDDGTVDVGATEHGEILANTCGVTPAAKFTYYQSGGHVGAWLNAYDTGHITRIISTGANFTANPNIYEWFLSNSRGGSTPPANTPPVANAGADQTITLPTSRVNLSGSGSGTNGATISSYAWSQVSGPSSAAIANAGAAATAVTGLVQGSYVFSLTVTDNHGLTNSASITVTVNAAPPANTPPVANAGADQTITLPTSRVNLSGSGNGTNGATISTYAWSQVSGPSSATIANAGAAATAVTGLVQGSYVFSLTVTDNHGLTNGASITVTVNAAPPANTPPVANAGADQTITLPTRRVNLSGSGNGTNGATISSYAWSQVSGPSSAAIANAGAAATAVTGLVQGSYVFSLTVTDNHGLTNSASITVTVNAAPPANTPPVANAGSAQTIVLPTDWVNVNGTGTGTNGATISSYAWSQVSGPSSAAIANPGSSVTSVTELVQGSYVFSLTVTDNHGLTNSANVTVTVNAAPPGNVPPAANAGNDQVITLPTNRVNLSGSGKGANGATISSYAWSQVSGPSSATIANAGAAATAVTGLVQGSYVFSLMVTDNHGLTNSASITVTVNAAPPANTPPVANAGADQTITLPTSRVNLSGSGSGTNGATISSYAWSQVSGPSSATIANAGAAATAVTGLVQGSYVFSLTVTDNHGLTNSASITVTVNAAPPANTPPVANVGADQTITLPTSRVNLSGSGSGTNGATISSYAWSQVSGPSSAAIANAGAAATAVTGLVQGSYVFSLTVTDNHGLTNNANITVTVNAEAHEPPVANAGSNSSITLPVNSIVLDGSKSSAPGGTISTYAWSKTSGPAAYAIANPAAASTAITGLVQGVYVFTLQVTDNTGAAASATVTVTVNRAPNQPPVANAGNNINITLPVNSASLNGTASYDPDGSIASYSWNKISGPGAITIVNSNTATPSIVGLTVGQYVFELTVTDNEGAAATAKVVVNVNPQPNRPPVANAGKDTSIALPIASVQLSGKASSDPDGSIAAYSWKEISGPTAAVIAQPSGLSTAVNDLAEGDYVFELQVTDNAGATNTARVKVSVVNNFRFSQFFKLYPNPATSTLNLQFIDDKTGKLSVSIYDVNSRLVKYAELSKNQSLLTRQIDISQLKPGVYYLEIRQGAGVKLIRPFVKQ